MQKYVLAKDPNQTTVTNAVQKDRIGQAHTIRSPSGGLLRAQCSHSRTTSQSRTLVAGCEASS